ncbi:hypothetical protein CEXT_13571 [Caerostris extrusa]|uniref:Uncharacterized protein n=1 Tax=Caerostris extrusa TaxID=172846 RepID=A0AAV4YCM7_CAEEX|nr:hypothetical protein CEXT_13571 [Caerostris extrusa]
MVSGVNRKLIVIVRTSGITCRFYQIKEKTFNPLPISPTLMNKHFNVEHLHPGLKLAGLPVVGKMPICGVMLMHGRVDSRNFFRPMRSVDGMEGKKKSCRPTT